MYSGCDNNRQSQQPQCVSGRIVGFDAADHQAPGVQRQGHPADHPQFPHAGKHRRPQVVDEHKAQSQHLEKRGVQVTGQLT